jgi:hypothetical protein
MFNLFHQKNPITIKEKFLKVTGDDLSFVHDLINAVLTGIRNDRNTGAIDSR